MIRVMHRLYFHRVTHLPLLSLFSIDPGASPVRGQLDTSEDFSSTGWRYLQCTDTINELRVLLPPETASIYGQLLRAELLELAALSRGDSAAWARLVRIRHLKDRMIRKCQRLRPPVPKNMAAPRVHFQVIHAPPDFRLKEMERWYREHGSKFAHTGTGEVYCCPRCEAMRRDNVQAPPRRQPPLSYRPSSVRASIERVPRRPVEPSRTMTYEDPSPHPLRQEARSRTSHLPRLNARPVSTTRPPSSVLPVPARSASEKMSYSSSTANLARANLRSPDPLPIPYRPRESEPSDVLRDSPSSQSPEPTPSASPPSDRAGTPPNGQALSTIPESPDRPGAQIRSLPRRRSSLKKCSSMSRLSVGSQSKSVAWAMDRDWTEQMSTYTKTANEAEVLGHELEQIRAEYHGEIETMRGLCRTVEQTSERVRLETETLRRQGRAVKQQENKLLVSSEQLEQKQAEFQAKVLAVLEETKRVVQLCDKKRDVHEGS
ncbi:hypothetical protein A0H81_01059 [Grifola frondosa]|uniref:Uncharacterized protein n=1 Tax=Grifola frondosa TaxID=5627 RepID=A0A1C7MT24_GRIFR|nr:hypothetical protein A0H81_01059 [Grifola frondosa]